MCFEVDHLKESSEFCAYWLSIKCGGHIHSLFEKATRFFTCNVITNHFGLRNDSQLRYRISVNKNAEDFCSNKLNLQSVYYIRKRPARKFQSHLIYRIWQARPDPVYSNHSVLSEVDPRRHSTNFFSLSFTFLYNCCARSCRWAFHLVLFFSVSQVSSLKASAPASTREKSHIWTLSVLEWEELISVEFHEPLFSLRYY